MGLLSPYKFIPIAEETNLIIPLGQWIIEQTCLQNKKWHDKGYRLTSAVNISAKQFIRSDLVQIIKNALKDAKLKPKYLELELTETILMENHENTENPKIQNRGYAFSLTVCLVSQLPRQSLVLNVFRCSGK